MGDVLVTAGRIAEGQIAELEVALHGLPSRKIDRPTTLAWMKDGHSLIPLLDGRRGVALQLVEVGEAHFIRHDNAQESQDSLPVGL